MAVLLKKKTSSPFGDRFVKATPEAYLKHRLLGLSQGEPGSRKTTFWLEAPGPIAVFSWDLGMEGVVNRILEEHPEKEIWVQDYEWFPTRDEDMQDKAIELRDTFIEDYTAALQIARTVVLDKETDCWALFRYAEFGPEGNDAPRNYPALNQRYRKLVNLAKASHCNVGFIQGMKDKWGEKINKKTGAVGAASTGERTPAGFGELEALVHMRLLHTGLSESDWQMHIGKVRGPGAMSVAGQTIPGVSFQDFAMMVFPESDLDDWN